VFGAAELTFKSYTLVRGFAKRMVCYQAPITATILHCKLGP